MDIDPRPVALDRFVSNAKGEMILVESDVQNVVNDLYAIDPHLRVRYSLSGGYYVVYWQDEDRESLVLTAEELDQRIVKRIQRIASEQYDYLKELEEADRRAERASKSLQDELLGEQAERLAHALRKDLRVFKDSARSKKAWGKGLVGH